MSTKYPTFSIQFKGPLKEYIKQAGEQLGFFMPSGKVNMGRTIRYLLMVGLREEMNLTTSDLAHIL